jgi:hypothetical protein
MSFFDVSGAAALRFGAVAVLQHRMRVSAAIAIGARRLSLRRGSATASGDPSSVPPRPAERMST